MEDGRARARRALSTVGLLAATWSRSSGDAWRGVQPWAAARLVPQCAQPRPRRAARWVAAAVCAPAGSRVATVPPTSQAAETALVVRIAAARFCHVGRASDAPPPSHPPRQCSGRAGRAAARHDMGTRRLHRWAGIRIFGSRLRQRSAPLRDRTAACSISLWRTGFRTSRIEALTPLGYRPTEDGSGTLVPTYAPGLPLTMAAFERIAGMNAVYAVMPLLAAIAVWFATGSGTDRRTGNGLGAAFLACVRVRHRLSARRRAYERCPCNGLVDACVVVLLPDRRWTATGAGVAAGMAILTGPNLLLVVVVLACTSSGTSFATQSIAASRLQARPVLTAGRDRLPRRRRPRMPRGTGLRFEAGPQPCSTSASGKTTSGIIRSG